MTAIGVTNRTGDYNRRTEAHDWKRRAERWCARAACHTPSCARAGSITTLPNQHQLCLLQGDTRHAGDPTDESLRASKSPRFWYAACLRMPPERKTFELVAEHGPAQTDLEALFAALDADAPGALDAVRDRDNQPLSAEPMAVREASAAFCR
jgi:hypothetical protein